MMLETIGRSKEPMSSYQIKKEMKGLGDAYVYDMIEELVPTRTGIGRYLFDWDDLPGNLLNQRKLFDKLDKIYDLKWLGSHKTYEDRESELLHYELLKFEKTDDNKFLTITHDSNQIGIALSETQSNTAYMIIHSGTKETIKETLVTQRKSGKLQVHLLEYTPIPIRYFHISINERGQKSISEIKNQKLNTKPDVNKIELETSSEVLKIQNDRQYWKYSLNIRGFILYISGLIQTDKNWDKNEDHETRHTERKRGRKKGDISYNRRRIDKTLEILSDNHLEDFPFLSYYREFKAVLPKNFLIDLVKEVADELRYQLDRTDISFLIYWITRRCYTAITDYFGGLERISQFLYLKNTDAELRTKSKNYRIHKLNVMVNYISREEQGSKQALERYSADR